MNNIKTFDTLNQYKHSTKNYFPTPEEIWSYHKRVTNQQQNLIIKFYETTKKLKDLNDKFEKAIKVIEEQNKALRNELNESSSNKLGN